MPESLYTLESMPLWSFSVKDLQRKLLVHTVCPSTHHYHHRSDKQTWVLIPRRRRTFFRSTYPVPPSCPMSSEAPTIPYRVVVQSTSTKDNNHTSCCPWAAQGSWVIDSWRRKLTFAFDFYPGQRRFDNVQNPAIVDGLITNVTTKDDQVRFWIGHRMAISFSWGPILDINDIPDPYTLADIEVE